MYKQTKRKHTHFTYICMLYIIRTVQKLSILFHFHYYYYFFPFGFFGVSTFIQSKAQLFKFTIFPKLKPIASLKALFARKVNKYSCIRKETEIRKVMKHFMDILGPLCAQCNNPFHSLIEFLLQPMTFFGRGAEAREGIQEKVHEGSDILEKQEKIKRFEKLCFAIKFYR